MVKWKAEKGGYPKELRLSGVEYTVADNNGPGIKQKGRGTTLKTAH